MNEIISQLSSVEPFNHLDKELLEFISSNSKVTYYPASSKLFDEHSTPTQLLWIIKGSVEVYDKSEELIDIYHDQDIFDSNALIEGIYKHSFIVKEELIALEIASVAFDKIMKSNSYVESYFLSNIVQKVHQLKAKAENSTLSEFMIARIDKNLLHKAVIVTKEVSIIDALKEQVAQNASTVLVAHKDGSYGIVTDSAIRQKFIIDNISRQSSIALLESYPVIGVDEDDFLFNALLKMTQHSIKKLPVFDKEGKIIGVLEQLDVLSFFSTQAHLTNMQIENASSLDELIKATKRIDTLVISLQTKSVKARYISKLVNELNKKMYQKLFEIIIPKEWHGKVALILLGSEGRGEQILRTDQDNAMIFEDGFIPDDKDKVSAKFIDALEQIGFPRCKGGVMITNPFWSKELSSFNEQSNIWLSSPNQSGFMDMAIFFDASFMAGEESLFVEAKKYMREKISQHTELSSHFAKAINNFESPLSYFGGFITDKKHNNEFDVKKGAIFPVIHGVRALAFEKQIEATNTFERLKELNNIGLLSRDETFALIEALEVILSFRLYVQLKKQKNAEPIDDFIDPNKLNRLERELLKEAIKRVNEFKKLINFHFKLAQLG